MTIIVCISATTTALVITRVDRRHHQQLSIGIFVKHHLHWTPPLIFAARYYASAADTVMQCLWLSIRPSVRPSVTFVNSVKKYRYLQKIFTIG